MRHPARGPFGTMGIDGKPNAAGRRPLFRSVISALKEAAV
jgi:hypothetical protein